MKLNRKLVLVLALVLSVAMATTGTLAYLTDRDSAVNVFSTGNVVIELVEEKFDQNKENMLLPGMAIDKEPYVKNTGSVDAYVWMQVAAPKGALGKLAPTTTDGEASSTVNKAIMLNDLSSDWQLYGDNNPTSATINGKECDVYTYKYTGTDGVLKAGNQTNKLFTSVSMSSTVDITPDGDVYSVVNGAVTDLNYNINEGKLPVYVSAYAIQAEGFDNFDEAYENYNTQWGTNGTEWGTAFKPSESLTEEEGVILINNASDLLAFANKVNNYNSFAGKTVKLTADIDLKDDLWTPIGYVAKDHNNPYFQGTFDGDGHTIKNLKVDMSKATDNNDQTTAGLFGWIDAAGATIKNLTIENADVKGNHYTGAIVGYLSGTIENCHVKNAKISSTHYDNANCGDKAGGVVGYLNLNASVYDCSVENSTVSAGRDAGQVVGCNYNGTNTISGCWAINVTVANNDTCTAASKGSNIQNGIIGRMQGTPTVNNATMVYNATQLGNALPNGGTIVLAADIDMNNAWTTAVLKNKDLTLEGGNHTITKLNAPLINFYGGTVKINNLKVANSAVVDNSGDCLGSGIILNQAQWANLYMNNCHVSNSTLAVSRNNRSGALVGYWIGGGEIKNCSVTNSQITNTAGSVGALVGHRQVQGDYAAEAKITNCTATGNKLTTVDSGWRVGTVIGTASSGNISMASCTSTDNTLKQTNAGSDVTKPEGQSEMYGRIVEGGTVTIDGVNR